jgi:hypothetical protein
MDIKIKILLKILKNNLPQQIIIFLLLIAILIPAYILTPKKIKSIILITPLSDLQFKDNFYSENIKINFSISEGSSIENIEIKDINQDTINNLNFSPLNLFYSFFKDTQKIVENEYDNDKIKVNFYGSSYEFFFSLEINSENKKNNIIKLTNILKDVEKSVFEKIINFEINHSQKLFIDKQNYDLVNYFKKKIAHKQNKINIYTYIILITLLSFFLNLLILKFNRKI